MYPGPFAMNHRMWRVGVIAALGFSVCGPAAAQQRDVYEVRDVVVDVTSETAAKAREQALAEGEAEAFRRLLKRLTLRAEKERLPDLEAEEITTYVKDFSVASEKVSAVRYLAHLNYRFKSGEIRSLLNDFDLRFAETVSKPVLVLPVYQDAGALMLWDEPNPWREAWGALPDTQSLVPTLLPVGDLADIAAIGPEQAMEGDLQRLNAIAKVYGASDTLVVFGVMRVDAARARRILEVYFTRYGTQLQEQTEVMNFTQNDGETVSRLLARAARELMAIVEENWKRDNVLEFGRSGLIAAVVPITGLRDWLEVRSRLEGVAVIQRAELVLLSHTEARVNLHFIGKTEQLMLALEQVDLGLSEEGGNWLLSLFGRPPPGKS